MVYGVYSTYYTVYTLGFFFAHSCRCTRTWIENIWKLHSSFLPCIQLLFFRDPSSCKQAAFSTYVLPWTKINGKYIPDKKIELICYSVNNICHTLQSWRVCIFSVQSITLNLTNLPMVFIIKVFFNKTVSLVKNLKKHWFHKEEYSKTKIRTKTCILSGI